MKLRIVEGAWQNFALKSSVNCNGIAAVTLLVSTFNQRSSLLLGAEIRFGFIASVSQLLVHDIEQRLVLPESLKLLDEQPPGVVEPVGGMVGAMRREQNILQFIKGMSLRQRFLIENIQRGTFDSAIRKRVDQRL